MWSNLQDLVGHALALHKGNWLILAWKEEKGEYKLVQEVNQTIKIRNRQGAESEITYLGSSKPEVALGFTLCQTQRVSPRTHHHHHIWVVLSKRLP